MKLLKISGFYALALVTACSTDTEIKQSEEKFPVANPVVMDTIYTNEYVADIHSVQNVEIRARVKGYIEAIHIDEGKPVKAGQLLFSISNKEYRESLTRAKAALKSAVAEEKSALVELQSTKSLVDKKVISKTELEIAQAKFEAASAKVESAKSDEASASLNLSLTEIKAPFDGIINRIPNKTGSLVDDGTLLTSISDNKEVFAYFNVSEKEYLAIISSDNSNQKKEVELLLANNELHKQKGVVETVDGEFDKTTGNIAFRARFSNPDGILKHGSSGKVRLRNELKNAMIIPQKSTFDIQEKTYVYSLNQYNELQVKSIVVKQRLGNFYVISSGLHVTDKIIYEGIQKAKEGEEILPQLITPEQMLSQWEK
ncbi:MAG: efflux RND transporter periplasmic adaptor subunit [Bacteroidota bacterium]|nr:efflux RND transporter periplasmic adaptor subunit [Bacteroidota bacterium]